MRRIADSGYSTLLMPDVPQWQPAPAPTLAVAAALADLRVGTWVYASPLRPAWSTAWEAHSLSVLTDGRFEMGIGTGRPGIEDELRARGLPVVPVLGRTRALGVSSKKRISSLPDVPTLNELGVKDFEAVSWHVLMVPSKTPKGIVDKLHAEMQKIMSDPEMKKRAAAAHAAHQGEA